MDVKALVRQATRETDVPDRAGGIREEAACELGGAIYQFSKTREDFIKSGLAYYETFRKVADEKIEELNDYPEDQIDKQFIEEIQQMIIEVEEIDREEFIVALGEEWDQFQENFGDEDE